MTAIITGDIVNSRQVNPSNWLPDLKALLNKLGPNPKVWEIYRGDSFQIKVDTKHALITVLLIKSLIKQNKDLDVRLAVGIGEISYETDKVTENNGTAAIYSGEGFDHLKKHKLIVKSADVGLDTYFNLLFKLLSLTVDEWKPATSKNIHHALLNPNLNQIALANQLGIKPATLSESLKKGGYHEILELLNLFENKYTGCHDHTLS